jgi:hypothetical protein
MYRFYYLLFLKASACFNGTKKYISGTSLKEVYIILVLSESKNIQGQQLKFRCLINFSTEILNNLNSVKYMIKGQLLQIFIPLKLKDLLAEKH